MARRNGSVSPMLIGLLRNEESGQVEPIELKLVPVSPNDNRRGRIIGVRADPRATAIPRAVSYRSLGEAERFFPRTMQARSRRSNIPRLRPLTQDRRQRMIDTMVEQAAADIMNQVTRNFERDGVAAVESSSSNELLIKGLNKPTSQPDRYGNAAQAYMRDRDFTQPFMRPTQFRERRIPREDLRRTVLNRSLTRDTNLMASQRPAARVPSRTAEGYSEDEGLGAVDNVPMGRLIDY